LGQGRKWLKKKKRCQHTRDKTKLYFGGEVRFKTVIFRGGANQNCMKKSNRPGENQKRTVLDTSDFQRVRIKPKKKHPEPRNIKRKTLEGPREEGEVNFGQ